MPAPNSVADFWRQVDKSGDCWLWTGAFPGGRYGKRYGRFGFSGRKIAAHRFSWEIAHGPVPAGFHVLHRCDRPACVNPKHLFLGTHIDNMQDMLQKNRRRNLRGAEQATAKLNDEKVIAIRRKYAAGLRQIDLAAEFGIDQTTVSKIVRRQTWTHVQEISP